MENKRRNFLKLTGLAGFGVFGSGILKGEVVVKYYTSLPHIYSNPIISGNA